MLFSGLSLVDEELKDSAKLVADAACRFLPAAAYLGVVFLKLVVFLPGLACAASSSSCSRRLGGWLARVGRDASLRVPVASPSLSPASGTLSSWCRWFLRSASLTRAFPSVLRTSDSSISLFRVPYIVVAKFMAAFVAPNLWRAKCAKHESAGRLGAVTPQTRSEFLCYVSTRSNDMTKVPFEHPRQTLPG